MKHKILALCLTGGLLLGSLTGCGTDVVKQAVDGVLKGETHAFSLGKVYATDRASVTVEAAFLSDCAMAPLTSAEDGAIMSYTATPNADQDADKAGNMLYLDCIASVENTGTKPVKLSRDLFFFCTADDKEYSDAMVLAENADGTALDDVESIESGKTVRLHYVLTLPEDVAKADPAVQFSLPDSPDTYLCRLSKLTPVGTPFTADAPLTSADGAQLTLKSAVVSDKVKALTDAGGGYELVSQAEGSRMVDIAIEVSNNGSAPVSLGTLYSGRMQKNGLIEPATLTIEQDNDMKYAGTIAAGSTAMTHMVFELSEAPAEDDIFFLWLDGKYYTISVSNAQ